MIVTVQLDTDKPEDAAALARLTPPAEWPPRDFPTQSERHAAAAKAEAKKAPAPEPEPEPENLVPNPSLEAAPEPEPAAEEAESVTAETAQARAVEVLSADGGRERVKAALKAAGAERISHLKPSQVATFMKELG